MSTDVWIPRLYAIGQICVLIACGVLIGVGEDSVVTDIFAAVAGGLTLTQGYRVLAKSNDPG